MLFSKPRTIHRTIAIGIGLDEHAHALNAQHIMIQSQFDNDVITEEQYKNVTRAINDFILENTIHTGMRLSITAFRIGLEDITTEYLGNRTPSLRS